MFVVLRREEYHVCLSMAMINHGRSLIMLDRAENSGGTHSGSREGGLPAGGRTDFAKSIDSPGAAVVLQLSPTRVPEGERQP